MTLLNEEIYIKILSDCKNDTDMLFNEMIKVLPIYLDKYPLDKEVSSFFGTEFKEETKILFKILYKTISDKMKKYYMSVKDNDEKKEFIEYLKSIEYVIDNIQLSDLKNPDNELLEAFINVYLFFKENSDNKKNNNNIVDESEKKHLKRIEQVNIQLKNSEIRSYISCILDKKYVADIVKLKNYKIYIINELNKFDKKIINRVIKYIEINIDKVNINTLDEINVFDFIKLQEIVNSYINIVELEY